MKRNTALGVYYCNHCHSSSNGVEFDINQDARCPVCQQLLEFRPATIGRRDSHYQELFKTLREAIDNLI